MFESEMEIKLNMAVEKEMTDERMTELKVVTATILEKHVTGLSFADAVVLRNYLNDTLTMYIIDEAITSEVVTEEEVDEAFNNDPITDLIQAMQEEMEAAIEKEKLAEGTEDGKVS